MVGPAILFDRMRFHDLYLYAVYHSNLLNDSALKARELVAESCKGMRWTARDVGKESCSN